jgi:hypothetical protein
MLHARTPAAAPPSRRDAHLCANGHLQKFDTEANEFWLPQLMYVVSIRGPVRALRCKAGTLTSLLRLGAHAWVFVLRRACVSVCGCLSLCVGVCVRARVCVCVVCVCVALLFNLLASMRVRGIVSQFLCLDCLCHAGFLPQSPSSAQQHQRRRANNCRLRR